jgi:hypothetical protein
VKRKVKIKYFKIEELSEYYITMGDKRMFLWYNKRDNQYSVNAISTWGDWKNLTRESFKRKVNIDEVSELEMILVCGTNLIKSAKETIERIMDEKVIGIKALRKVMRKRKGSE